MSEAVHLSPSARLTEQEVAMLAFERGWRGTPAGREPEVRDRFGLSLPSYLQRLNALIDQPAALAHDPLLVKRLRRLREQRQAARSAARLR